MPLYRFEMHFVRDMSEVPRRKRTWLTDEVAIMALLPSHFQVLHMAVDPTSDLWITSR